MPLLTKGLEKKLRIPHNRSFSHIRKGRTRRETTKKHSRREALTGADRDVFSMLAIAARRSSQAHW